MFAELDGEYQFEELPIRIDGKAIALCWGSASYDVNNDGTGEIMSITLSGLKGEEASVELSVRDTDPRKKWLFHMLAEEIENSRPFQREVCIEYDEWKHDKGYRG